MRHNSFQQQDRLRKRFEFITVFRKGVSVRNRYFIANIHDSGCKQARLGITVSKKVGNAVTRNRIKRITREVFRHRKRDFPAPRDLNIVAAQQVGALPNRQVRSLLNDLFKRIDHHLG